MSIVLGQVGFRPGLPEWSTRNPLSGPIESSSSQQKPFEGPPAGAMSPAPGSEPGGFLVIKRRVSALAGTEFDPLLHPVNTLVLAARATSGIGTSTVLDAGDRDWGRVVVDDGCANDDIRRTCMAAGSEVR